MIFEGMHFEGMQLHFKIKVKERVKIVENECLVTR